MTAQKVAFVITGLDTGGAELALERYVSLLSSRGQVVFVCSLISGGAIGQRLMSRDIPVYSLETSKLNAPLALVRLVRILRRERPDIVCSMMFHANILSRIARMFVPVRTLLCMERTMSQESRIRRWFNRATAPLADRVLAVSPAVKRFCVEQLKFPPAKVDVLENGVDLERFSRPPDVRTRAALGLIADDFVVTCVANLRPIKGHRYLLEGFAAVARRHRNAKLLLVGEGEYASQLRELAATLELEGKVIFAGAVNDVAPVLSASDVFVLPSLAEGMSNALLEASASGLAIVATCVGGTPDIIRDGDTGLLVRARDSEAIAEAIQRVLSDSVLRARLGASARAFVAARYSQQAEGERLLSLIESLNEKAGALALSA